MELALFRLRHSLAHVMAQAVRDIFAPLGPVHFAGGPPIEHGFYYDFALARPLVPADLDLIEERMRQILKRSFSFAGRKVSVSEARQLFADQPFKSQLIDGLVGGQMDEDGNMAASQSPPDLFVFQHEDFIDLCRGPHIGASDEVPEHCFKLLKIAGAYWRGDEHNPMLQRIYGAAFLSAGELSDHLRFLAEAELRDHRKIGKELKLFFFHPSAPAMPYWLPHGFSILNTLIQWWREVHQREAYDEISSPLVNAKSIWETSGHWEYYRDEMFLIDHGEKGVFGIKPMNCPNAMVVFNHEHHSYRDLPLRLADCDILHRHERSGVMHGLLRVQKFQQDDAHIFVEDDNEAIMKEFASILRLVDEFYAVFQLSYRFRLATQPSQSLGASDQWQRAEACLRQVLEKRAPGAFEVAEGDGAFYGPKIDILIKDCLGRDWQMGTLQLDFQLPRRFDCQYVDSHGQRRHPAVIHRVIYGSMERFIGILLEHCAGKLPMWLAPQQVWVMPVGERHRESAEAFLQDCKRAGIRAHIEGEGTLGQRMRNWRLQRIPYAAMIGDRESSVGDVSLRRRDAGENIAMERQQCVEYWRKEVEGKKWQSSNL